MWVSPRAVSPIEIITSKYVVDLNAWMKAKGIRDVYPGHSLYNIIANFDKDDVMMLELQNVSESKKAREEIVYIRA